jgi:hypothetical protein
MRSAPLCDLRFLMEKEIEGRDRPLLRGLGPNRRGSWRDSGALGAANGLVLACSCLLSPVDAYAGVRGALGPSGAALRISAWQRSQAALVLERPKETC